MNTYQVFKGGTFLTTYSTRKDLTAAALDIVKLFNKTFKYERKAAKRERIGENAIRCGGLEIRA